MTRCGLAETLDDSTKAAAARMCAAAGDFVTTTGEITRYGVCLESAPGYALRLTLSATCAGVDGTSADVTRWWQAPTQAQPALR